MSLIVTKPKLFATSLALSQLETISSLLVPPGQDKRQEFVVITYKAT